MVCLSVLLTPTLLCADGCTRPLLCFYALSSVLRALFQFRALGALLSRRMRLWWFSAAGVLRGALRQIVWLSLHVIQTTSFSPRFGTSGCCWPSTFPFAIFCTALHVLWRRRYDGSCLGSPSRPLSPRTFSLRFAAGAVANLLLLSCICGLFFGHVALHAVSVFDCKRARAGGLTPRWEQGSTFRPPATVPSALCCEVVSANCSGRFQVGMASAGGMRSPFHFSL